MKLVGYLRVSTDRQAEDGLGLEVQEQTIRTWARAHGHRIAVWARDEGVSGSNGLGNREGLLDALDAIRDRRVRGVVVYRLDRLARDLIVQEQVLAEVRRLGGKVFSTSAAEAGYLTDDPDDPSRKLIRQVLGAVAEYERSMIALRLRSGRRRKADKGGYAYGGPPYGWRAERGELVPVEAEQAALSRMRELRDEGRSLRDIARTLTEEGHRPRGRKPRRDGTDAETQGWHSAAIGRILARVP